MTVAETPFPARFIVSRRGIGAGMWPLADAEAIARARRGVDAGKIILTRWRCKATNEEVLFAIPRRRPAKEPRPFFDTACEGA